MAAIPAFGRAAPFDLPADRTWLNASYMTPDAVPVRAAAEQALDRTAAPWTVHAEDFFSSGEVLRQRFAAIVNADAEGVALVPAVSYGMSTLAANLSLDAGQQIVVIEDQYPSNVYPWRRLAERTAASIVTVARPTDLDWASAVLDAIDDSTGLVAVPNVHWSDGSLLDLVAIGAAARSVGARLVVDGSQSFGVLPFDVAEVQPDAICAVGYKWLLGPYALGYLWVAPELRDGDPLEQGWMTRVGSHDFAHLAEYRDGWQPGARRYDVGEASHFLLAPMAIAALDLVLAYSPSAIADHLRGLTSRIEDGARDLGLAPVPAKRRGDHLIGLRFPDNPPATLVDTLAAARVHVSVRGSAVRVSPHVYNTLEDAERLLDVLASTIG